MEPKRPMDDQRMNSKTALVSGGTGFIGSHLVRRLVGAGIKTHVLARAQSIPWRIDDLASRLTVWRCDLTDPPSLDRCLSNIKPDLVFHLSGNTSGKTWSENLSELDLSIQVNLQGTLNLVRALHTLKLCPLRFVRGGGISEYGIAPVPFREDEREQPMSAYSASQAAATMFLGALSRHLAFPVVTIRLPSVYGPARSLDSFVPSLIAHCLESRDFDMGAGDLRWDMLYVEDAVDALLRASEANIPSGEIINLSSGTLRSLREVAEMIVRKIGSSSQLRVGSLPSRGDIEDMYSSGEKARELLHWAPKISLDTGLDTTILWYRRHLMLMKRMTGESV